MNASAPQPRSTNAASLGTTTTRFIRMARGQGWEGLRVLPVVISASAGKDDDRAEQALTD